MRFLKDIHTGKIQSINKWIDQFEQARETGDISGAERVKEQLENGDLVLDYYCTEYIPSHKGKYCSFCKICEDEKIYKYEIICQNLRGATNLLCAAAKEIIYMARQARMFKRNGFPYRYMTEINRCKELFNIYRQIKKQWSKMEYPKGVIRKEN